MKLTSRGKDLLLALLAESSLALLFTDPLLAAASLGMSAALAADAFTARARARESASALSQCKLSERFVRLPAGASKTITAELPRPLTASASAEPDWVTVLATGNRLHLHIAPRSFGRADVKLRLEARSRLGLWEHEAASTPLLTVLALPRATPLLLRALSALAGAGSGDEGGESARASALTRGLEYSDSRRYQPGDSLRRIDWPATTRLRELIVRRYVSGEGSALLAVNLDAPGPTVLDFTMTALLSAAIAAAREGLSTSLLRIEAGSAELAPALSPQGALALAAKLALEKLHLGYEPLEHILPEPSARLAGIAAELGAADLSSVFTERASQASSIARRLEKGSLVLLIGPLTSNIQLIVDLVSEVRGRARLAVVTHPKPWVDAKTPEEARAIEQSHRRVLAFLSKHFRVHTSPTAAAAELALHALSLREKAAP